MSCQARMDRTARATDDNTCLYGPGTLEIVCRGSSWSPVIDNVFGALICTVFLAEKLDASGLKLGNCYPVKIVGVDDGAARKAAPEYVFFRPSRGLTLNPDYFDWPKESPYAKSRIPYRKVPVPCTWTGQDLFGILDQTSRALIVSRQFVLHAKLENWQSFLFTALDIPHDRRLEAMIRIGREKWPPVWYPTDVQPHADNR